MIYILSRKRRNVFALQDSARRICLIKYNAAALLKKYFWMFFKGMFDDGGHNYISQSITSPHSITFPHVIDCGDPGG